MKMVAASKLRAIQSKAENSRGLWQPFTALLGDLPSKSLNMCEAAQFICDCFPFTPPFLCFHLLLALCCSFNCFNLCSLHYAVCLKPYAYYECLFGILKVHLSLWNNTVFLKFVCCMAEYKHFNTFPSHYLYFVFWSLFLHHAS